MPMQVDGQANVAVTHDPVHVLDLLKGDLLPIVPTCAQAEIFEHQIYYRAKAVFSYLNQPLDAELPPQSGRRETCAYWIVRAARLVSQHETPYEYVVHDNQKP